MRLGDFLAGAGDAAKCSIHDATSSRLVIRRSIIFCQKDSIHSTFMPLISCRLLEIVLSRINSISRTEESITVSGLQHLRIRAITKLVELLHPIYTQFFAMLQNPFVRIQNVSILRTLRKKNHMHVAGEQGLFERPVAIEKHHLHCSDTIVSLSCGATQTSL